MKSILLSLLIISLVMVPSVNAEEKATKEECVAKCEAAAKVLKESGREAALQQVADPNGPFVWKDSYIFCIDKDSNAVIAHPITPKLVGKKLTGVKDKNGKLFFLEFLNVAKEQGKGWVSYMWPKPGEKEPSPKISYVYLPEGESVIFIAGIYED